MTINPEFQELDIMTPEHPRWDEFCSELDHSIACDQCYDECAGAREILTKYAVDIDASVEYFREHGGFCDCEILMNVDSSVD
jgi:hypothetical protein